MSTEVAAIRRRGAGAIAARRLATPERVVLGIVAIYAVIPLVLLMRHAAAHGLVFSGIDSPFPGDEAQYLSWIRDAGGHALGANAFDVAPRNHVFLHPMFLLSGLVWRAGASLPLAYLLWKPVAVIGLFLGFRAYVRRFVAGRTARAVTLALGLFFATPAAALVGWASFGSPADRAQVQRLAGELMPAGSLWGYLPTALALALMPLFLLGIERLVDGAAAERRRRDVVLVSACGALVSWLHPWQGETLLVILAAAVALGVPRRRLPALAAPVLATAAPLLYYLVLSRADSAWRFAQHANAVQGRFPAWAIAACLLPLALPALAGLRAPVQDLGERMLRIWPLAVAAVYLVLSPSFPQHAFEGLSLPLGILAVRGLARGRRRTIAVAALAAILAIPGTVFALQSMRDIVNAGNQPFYLSHGEDRALSYLADVPQGGAVMTTPYLGTVVPWRTGRETWIGHPSWTPHLAARVAEANALFDGMLPSARAVAIVRASHVTFVLDDCAHRPAALGAIRPIVVSVRRFGCAGVYRVR